MNTLRKKITTTLFATSLLSTASIAVAAPDKPTAAIPAQERAKIERVVHDYMLKNPEILIQMTQLLQQNETKKNQDRIKNAVPENAEALFNDGFSPVKGNKAGKVTLVQFFDYQCGHCRRMDATLEALPEKHANLRMVYKVFPIFGAESEFASRAALAAVKQNKFNEMHNALMRLAPPLSKKKVLAAAKTVGIDTKQLQQDVRSPEVDKEIAANFDLAKSLGIQGTPSFIISNPSLPTTAAQQKENEVVFLPGAVDEETLNKMIAKFK